MPILFVGDLTPYLTTKARCDALLDLGFEIESFDQVPIISGGFAPALAYRTLLTPSVFALDREIAARADGFRPDVAWLEKGTFIFPRTIRRLRGTVHDLHWRFLRRTIDYDLHITSNRWNVDAFRAASSPRVVHMELAANPALRDPGAIPEAERAALGGRVGFVGHWQPARKAWVDARPSSTATAR